MTSCIQSKEQTALEILWYAYCNIIAFDEEIDFRKFHEPKFDNGFYQVVKIL